jgi:hypothetical protein
MFMQENMDIKDRSTTSSKEQLRSLVRDDELMKSLPMVARTEVLQTNIPRLEAQKTGIRARRTSILDVRMTLSK